MPAPEAKFRAGATGAAPIPLYGFSDHVYSEDDTQLIRQAQAGRWEAFAEVASHYDRSILVLALRLTGSEREALKLLQQALITAYRELRSYRFHCSFYIWIYRIVVRTCLEFLEENHATVTPATQREADRQQLSPRERMVLELKECLGLKLETIAAMLGIQEAAARNALVRAIVTLQLAQEARAVR